jgi:hypothetical protein
MAAAKRLTGMCSVERNMIFETPMDFLFYLSIVSNTFSILGLAGVLNQQRDLVTAFFTYNAVQMVVAFHYFVDVCADIGIRFKGQSQALDSYEQSAAGAPSWSVKTDLTSLFQPWEFGSVARHCSRTSNSPTAGRLHRSNK